MDIRNFLTYSLCLIFPFILFLKTALLRYYYIPLFTIQPLKVCALLAFSILLTSHFVITHSWSNYLI